MSGVKTALRSTEEEAEGDGEPVLEFELALLLVAGGGEARRSQGEWRRCFVGGGQSGLGVVRPMSRACENMNAASSSAPPKRKPMVMSQTQGRR